MSMHDGLHTTLETSPISIQSQATMPASSGRFYSYGPLFGNVTFHEQPTDTALKDLHDFHQEIKGLLVAMETESGLFELQYRERYEALEAQRKAGQVDSDAVLATFGFGVSDLEMRQRVSALDTAAQAAISEDDVDVPAEDPSELTAVGPLGRRRPYLTESISTIAMETTQALPAVQDVERFHERRRPRRMMQLAAGIAAVALFGGSYVLGAIHNHGPRQRVTASAPQIVPPGQGEQALQQPPHQQPHNISHSTPTVIPSTEAAAAVRPAPKKSAMPSPTSIPVMSTLSPSPEGTPTPSSSVSEGTPSGSPTVSPSPTGSPSSSPSGSESSPSPSNSATTVTVASSPEASATN